MIGMMRVGAAETNDHGQAVLSAKQYDFDAAKFDEQLYLVDLTAASSCAEGDRYAHRHITRLTGTKFKSNNSPQFSPDGDHVAFLSNRTGSTQVFVLPVRGAPGEAQQLTDLPVDIGDLVWHASGSLLFSAGVYVDDDTKADPIQATVDRDTKAKDNKTNAILFTSLPVRQWDRWLDAKMNHVFSLAVRREGNSYRAEGPPKDLLAGVPGECPVSPFGGTEDFSMSASHLALSMRAPLLRDEAWTTNRHIYLIELASATHGNLGKCLTESNQGYDLNPRFSPDGQHLAWLSMTTPQYEADAQRIKIYDMKKQTERTLAGEWDHDPESLAWSKNGKFLIVCANMRARKCICTIDLETERIYVIAREGCNSFYGELPTGQLVYAHTTLSCPAELWICDAKGASQMQLSFFNQFRLSELSLGMVSDIVFTGAMEEKVQAWFVYPAGVQSMQDLPAKSVPMAVVIHGGPQSAIMDGWHYRWHLQTYAARGYATLSINFHGSTGFGHKFCRSISGDWGGAPFEDIIAGCRHILAEYPCIDPGRVCALGASYGGFMINFLNGNAPPDFFKCLVCHDGLFSFESSYYSTEELFFMEYDFKGVPWDASEGSPYRCFSPHLKVASWKTPTLVIHGSKDYRIAETEGIAAFQALQRQGVPSELLVFPTENHWVLNPLNSLVWHDKVLSWLDRWCSESKL